MLPSRTELKQPSHYRFNTIQETLNYAEFISLRNPIFHFAPGENPKIMSQTKIPIDKIDLFAEKLKELKRSHPSQLRFFLVVYCLADANIQETRVVQGDKIATDFAFAASSSLNYIFNKYFAGFRFVLVHSNYFRQTIETNFAEELIDIRASLKQIHDAKRLAAQPQIIEPIQPPPTLEPTIINSGAAYYPKLAPSVGFLFSHPNQSAPNNDPGSFQSQNAGFTLARRKQ